MGNIKESILPYLKKEMKLAKLSFDLYGAVSPTQPVSESPLEDEIKKDRILTQVELESSAPDVCTKENKAEHAVQSNAAGKG